MDIFGAFKVTEMNLQMNLRGTFNSPDAVICSMGPNGIFLALIVLSGHSLFIAEVYCFSVCCSTFEKAHNIKCFFLFFVFLTNYKFVLKQKPYDLGVLMLKIYVFKI